MPLFGQPVPGPLAGHRFAVELAAEPNRKVADVNHFLHFADGFGSDFSCLEGHELAKLGLVGVKLLAKSSYQFTTAGCGPGPKVRKCFGCRGDRLIGLFGGGCRQLGERLPVDWRTDGKRFTCPCLPGPSTADSTGRILDPQCFEQRFNVVRHGTGLFRGGFEATHWRRLK